MRTVFAFGRVAICLLALGFSLYRFGFRGWLSRQQPFEWAIAAGMLAVFACIFAFERVRKSTVLITFAWFAAGLGSTGAFFWLCWYTWMHPAFRNWYTIPLIGALGIFAFFVFWNPLLMSLNKATRLVNRVEIAIERSDPNAERYLFEARQGVGAGKRTENAYLDAYEGKLRHSRGELTEAVKCLERALSVAFASDNRVLGLYAARVLVQVLVDQRRQTDALALVSDIEEQWGNAPELRLTAAAAG